MLVPQGEWLRATKVVVFSVVVHKLWLRRTSSLGACECDAIECDIALPCAAKVTSHGYMVHLAGLGTAPFAKRCRLSPEML